MLKGTMWSPLTGGGWQGPGHTTALPPFRKCHLLRSCKVAEKGLLPRARRCAARLQWGLFRVKSGTLRIPAVLSCMDWGSRVHWHSMFEQ